MKTRLFLGAAMGAAYAWTQRAPQVKMVLKNKVALVTGASSGIGEATARAFAARGARVVVVARSGDLLDAVAESIHQTYETDALPIVADISLEKDLKRIMDQIDKRFGRVDVLVNNAGHSRGGAMQTHKSADLRKIVTTNLIGMIRLTQLTLPGMLERQYGQIVNISSIGGILLPPGLSVYGMTKAGIDAFSQSLRRELNGGPVGVTVIFPGWTRTRLIARMNPEKMRETLLVNPFLPLGEPDEVAQEIVDAVRYKKREVIMGGGLPQLAYALPWVSSHVTDWVYRYIYDHEAIMRVMKNIGAG